ncbi:hypothetical protein D3C87_102200 [compost metagenome]
MNKLVVDKVKEAKKSSSGQTVPLKEALQAVYSRPNDDEMIDKVVAPLRSNLDNHEAWEKTLSQLTDEAVNALKNPKAFKPVVQVTYVVFLENLLSEIKPYLKQEGFERTLAIRIRDAKIQITKDAENERKVRTMKGITSPSEIAASVLKSVDSAVVPQTSTESTDSGQ